MRRWGLVGLVGVLTLSLVTPATGGSKHPNSKTQPPKDGCERDPLGLVAGTSPQWAYVHRSRKPRLLRGRAIEARPTETDLFRAHDSYDMNIFFRPARRYRRFLGTANVRGEETQNKDVPATMEIEWEERAYRPWAWPSEGDRVIVMGSWIWDCGHWGPQNFNDPRYFTPGTQQGEEITGERTEIHPPRMVIIKRKVRSMSRRGHSVADVMISSQGTFARGIEDHASGYCEQPSDTCDQWTAVNDRNYRFNVTAPPKPPGAHKLVWDVIDHHSVNAPRPRVTRRHRHIHVFVPFKDFGKDGDKMKFAKRFKVGWDASPRVRRLRVRLRKLKWLAELDGAQPFTCVPEQPCTGSPQDSQPPDEVVLYIDIGGVWRHLHVPGLLSVSPGEAFKLHNKIDLFLSGHRRWRILGRGRECDQPKMRECPAPEEAGLNDDAGVFKHHFRTTRGATGRHVAFGRSDACRVDAKSPCYKLVYRIRRIGHRRH